ncbi:MAG: 50S ribosomal protein L11 methyltransferase [Patescibacteria group bacterium]|nr:50S ribosomal protein L11 methyltransferase [Patescibacteria group bacterium]
MIPLSFIFLFLKLLLVVFVIILLLTFSLPFFGGVPYVPTPEKRVKKMLELAQLKQGEKLVDLGSGDGRILIEAARIGAEAVGYEIDPLLVLTSKKLIKKEGLENKIKIYRKSFWQADLKDADVVTFYGITGIMGRMEKKLLRELKPGARVCSYVFAFPRWEPVRYESGIFLYQKS